MGHSHGLDSTDEVGEVQGQRIVVLDTSVLIADPEALNSYSSAEVVLPLIVIQELDKFKGEDGVRGVSSRRARATLEQLRVAAGGNLETAAKLPSGGYVRIQRNGVHLDAMIEAGLVTDRPDDRIIGVALGLAKTHPLAEVKLVSQDLSMRILGSSLGLITEEYMPASGKFTGASDGWYTLDISGEAQNAIHKAKPFVGVKLSSLSAEDQKILSVMEENEFADIHGALVRRKGDSLVKLSAKGPVAYGLTHRSLEQRFALELLLDPDVPIVALEGPAGVGKTILAMAAAMQAVVEEGRQAKISIFRPVVAVGKADLGFLPGDLLEKSAPWFIAVQDTMTALTGDSKMGAEERARKAKENLEYLRAKDKLEFGSIAHIRGRTLAHQTVIVDEVQNLEVGTVKALLTRLGENGKIILLGDVSQGDSPYTSADSNGLAVAIRAFTGSPLFGHIVLHNTERSEVAALASRLL